MNLNVKDEILAGEPKYRIKQNDITLYDNVTVEMTTEVQQQGTPINKALFDGVESIINQTGKIHLCTLSQSELNPNSNLIIASNSFISSYYIGEKIYIRIPNEFNTNTSKTYININGLGEKEINGALFKNMDYILVYDGEKFNATSMIEKPITNRIVPTTGWTADTDTAEYKPTAYSVNNYGRWKIAGTSSSKNPTVANAVDNNQETYLPMNDVENAYFELNFPTSFFIAPTILEIIARGDFTSIQGKNEKGTWETVEYVKIASLAIDVHTNREILLISPKYYSAIRVNMPRTDTYLLNEFNIMQGHYKFKM